jgi:hypothetical protein
MCDENTEKALAFAATTSCILQLRGARDSIDMIINQRMSDNLSTTAGVWHNYRAQLTALLTQCEKARRDFPGFDK